MELRLQAFTPFIPFNARDSALPLAFFVFKVKFFFVFTKFFFVKVQQFFIF